MTTAEGKGAEFLLPPNPSLGDFCCRKSLSGPFYDQPA
jgi:hypothetical protein